MKVNKSILGDLVIAVLLTILGMFALVQGYIFDSDKLKDLGFLVLVTMFIFVNIIQLRNQELKHYKELKKEIREMQNLADNTP